MPWIVSPQINSGKPLGDSYFIIKAIQEAEGPSSRAATIDDWLTAEQKAVARAFTTVLEESVYWGGETRGASPGAQP